MSGCLVILKCLVGRFHLQLYDVLCIHSEFFLWNSKQWKNDLFILSLANTKHFMLSAKHIFCVYKQIGFGHPRFDKSATPEPRKCAGTSVVQQHSMEQIISIWEIFRPWKAFNVSESFSGVFGNTVFVSLVNGLEFGPGGITGRQKSA